MRFPVTFGRTAHPRASHRACRRSLSLPRALLVFAHPDDEVVAVGARLPRMAASMFVHVTDGAPRNEQDSRAHGFSSLDEYRDARRAEFGRALALAGISNVPCRRLEIPDQESALRLAEITRRLADLISDFRPEAVFTHPWEGGHPDHDACAFAVHHAVELTQRADLSLPAIVEAAFYHEAEGRFETGCFLPDSAPAATVVYQLSPEEQARKQALLDCFVTQRQTLAGFSLDCEQFRIAPRYDFCRPRPGPVLYDRYPWGMSSQRFCALAQAAEEELAHA